MVGLNSEEKKRRWRVDFLFMAYFCVLYGRNNNKEAGGSRSEYLKIGWS